MYNSKTPNIVLVMADDLGWGDVGYNGNKTARTPELDKMAAENVKFNRFYAAAPVCSPTRGSCLTGRHPYRYGIPWANTGFLPAEEVTIGDAMRSAGYRTGHFGKWHVGTLSRTSPDSTRGGSKNPHLYAPPWERGFDVCCSTESWMPTFNPAIWPWEGTEPPPPEFKWIMDRAVEEATDLPGMHKWPASYWTGEETPYNGELKGDDSRFVMDQALRFIEDEVSHQNPFLALIWFHSPHTPIAAGNRHRALFPDFDIEAQHWFGCISAMDEQVGRLRKRLRKLKVADDTIVWFCSDNGPSYIHNYNSAGHFRGKKADLYEGGIRVPGIFEWPGEFKDPLTIDTPICTSDFYPTLTSLAETRISRQPVLDGIDVMPILKRETSERPSSIAFQSPLKGEKWEKNDCVKTLALSDNRYKLFSKDDGESWELYDLITDPAENNNIANSHPETVAAMSKYILNWTQSCENSARGLDYKENP